MEVPFRPRKKSDPTDLLSSDALLILVGVITALCIVWLNTI